MLPFQIDAGLYPHRSDSYEPIAKIPVMLRSTDCCGANQEGQYV